MKEDRDGVAKPGPGGAKILHGLRSAGNGRERVRGIACCAVVTCRSNVKDRDRGECPGGMDKQEHGESGDTA
jgi:hypothetical protein